MTDRFMRPCSSPKMRRRAILPGQPAGLRVAVAGAAATSASRPVPISAIRSVADLDRGLRYPLHRARISGFRFTPVEELPAILRALSV